jgi:hypothetical protein
MIEEIPQISDSIVWLKTIVPKHFGDSKFDLEFIPGEEENDWLLALVIYGSFSVLEFRSRRHAICNEIRDAGHKIIYDMFCVFQRRKVEIV